MANEEHNNGSLESSINSHVADISIALPDLRVESEVPSSETQSTSTGTAEPPNVYVAENIEELLAALSPTREVRRSGSIERQRDWAAEPDYCSTRVSRSSSVPALSEIEADSEFGAARLPPIDPHVLADLDTHVRRIANSVYRESSQLRRSLHTLSALGVCCLQTQRDGVERTCTAANNSIRAMYTLMARCEDLRVQSRQATALLQHVRELRAVVDRLEAQMKPLGLMPQSHS